MALTPGAAINRLTENLAKWLSTFAFLNKELLKEFSVIAGMPEEEKIKLIRQMKPLENNLDLLLDGFLMKYNHRKDEFKPDDLSKLKRYFEAMIAAV